MSYIQKRGVNSTIRKMTARQQASDVFSYGYIITCKANGKETQKLVEKLITLSKKGTLADKRRIASAIIRTKKYEKDELLKKIYVDIAQRYRSRKGGCTRLVKTQDKDRVLLALV
ncbi:50S ribosomal protein L17-like [Rattus rattus]|uniref:50S ribosomal protein L17-like n=1 Tax=Rattus rattus TaxID=10117 RepID=UPI0013F302A7|nr:50S ribosomal protein L17-like [Rattus rattus]